MKKLTLLTIMFYSFSSVACKEENKTVYDYLNDEPLLRSTLADCKSGKLNNYDHTCNVVKKAYALLDPYKEGIIPEEKLKKWGKK